MTGGDDVRTQTPERASESIIANIKNRAATKYLALTLLATTPAAMTSCETIENNIEPRESAEQLAQRLHLEAEAYADAQGWSQGVKSLAAGEIDYYYYREKEGGPILIRLSYVVDVDDFIAKIEADAAARGTYDPKTEGVFQASVVSLEGDSKQNTWFVPSGAIYEAKAQGKDKLSLEIGKYPSPNPGRNTIGVNEGLIPDKEMQLYSSFGINNEKYTDPSQRVRDQEKRGELKNIL